MQEGPEAHAPAFPGARSHSVPKATPTPRGPPAKPISRAPSLPLRLASPRPQDLCQALRTHQESGLKPQPSLLSKPTGGAGFSGGGRATPQSLPSCPSVAWSRFNPVVTVALLPPLLWGAHGLVGGPGLPHPPHRLCCCSWAELAEAWAAHQRLWCGEKAHVSSGYKHQKPRNQPGRGHPCLGSEGGADLCAGRLLGLWKLVFGARRHGRKVGMVEK